MSRLQDSYQGIREQLVSLSVELDVSSVSATCLVFSNFEISRIEQNSSSFWKGKLKKKGNHYPMLKMNALKSIAIKLRCDLYFLMR